MAGGELVIDEKLIKQIVEVEKGLKGVDKATKSVEKSFPGLLSSIKEINDYGFEPFLKKLGKTRSYYKTLVDSFKNKKAFSGLVQGAKSAIADIDNLSSSLMKLYELQNKKQYSAPKSTNFVQSVKSMEGMISSLRGEQVGLDLNKDAARYNQLETAIQRTQNSLDALTQRSRQLREDMTRTNAAVAQFNDLMTKKNNVQQGVTMDKSLHNMRVVLGDLVKAQETLNLRTSDGRKQYKALEKQIAKVKDEMDKATSKTPMQKYSEAMSDYKKVFNKTSPKSISSMEDTLRKMKDAQESINVKTEAGKKRYEEMGKAIKQVEGELNKYKNKTQEVTNQKSRLMQLSDNLSRAWTMLYSTKKIFDFASKIVNVRKEIELQNKSMEIILQNKDEADKIWRRTLDLAVQSPLSIKELITYTKQLAAYRIENEKLHETTRRLADVSVGLGVDMQRLILAYGQVRAAGYLRATELRQFTEAGIPMLDELAKHFSEVEERAISTADVFDMISRRAVDFKDVEEVFKRMTDEGGVFFDMQRKQSETMYGLIAKVQDKITLMFNSIGEENEELIKGMLNTALKLSDSWREVLYTLKPVIAAYIALKGITKLNALGVKSMSVGDLRFFASLKESANKVDVLKIKLQGLTQGLKKSINPIVLFKKGLRGLTHVVFGVGSALKTILPLLALTAIVEGVRRLTEATREMARFKEETQKIVGEEVGKIDELSKKYESLVDKLDRVNEGSNEHKEVVEQLNNQYGEYLDFLVDETTSVEQLANAYDSVNEKIKNKYALQAYERGRSETENEYFSQRGALDQGLKDVLKRMSYTTESGAVRFLMPSDKEMNDIVSIFKQRLENASEDELKRKNFATQMFQSIVKEYTGIDSIPLQFYDEVNKYQEEYIKYREKVLYLEEQINNEIKGGAKNKNERLATNQLEALDKELEKNLLDISKDKTKSKYEKYVEAEAEKMRVAIEKLNIKKSFGLIGDKEYKEQREKIEKWETPQTKSFNDSLKAAMEERGVIIDDYYTLLIDKEEQSSKSLDNIYKDLKTNTELHLARLTSLIEKQEQGVKISEKEIKEEKKKVQVYEIAMDAMEYTYKLQRRISKETISDVNSKVDSKYRLTSVDALKTQNELMEEANKKAQEAKAIVDMLNASKSLETQIDEEHLKIAKKDYEQYTLLWRLLGGIEKEKSSTTSIEERLRLLREMREEYKRLRKDAYGEEEATTTVNQKYADAFKKAFGNMQIGDFFKTDDETVKKFDEIGKNFAKNASDQLKVAIAKGDYKLETEIKLRKEELDSISQSVEDAFGEYKMYIELETMGVTPEVATSLFGIESKSLDDVRKKILNSYLEKFDLQSREYDTSSTKKLVDSLKEDTTLISQMTEDAYNKMLEDLQKLSQEEEKVQKERLNTYVKYLVETQEEAVKIKIEEAKKIREIESLQIDAHIKDQMIEGVKRESEEKLQKELWKDFKGSETFLMMNQDLEHMGKKALKKAIERLKEFKGQLKDLSPSEIKEIASLLDNAENALAKISFPTFKEIGTMLFDWSKIGSIRKNNEAIAKNEETISAEKGILADLKAAQTLVNLGEDEQKAMRKYGLQDKGIKNITEGIEKYTESIEKLEGANEDLKKANEDPEEQARKLEATATAVDALRQEWNKVYASVGDVLDSYGVFEDETKKASYDAIGSLVDMGTQALVLGLQMKAAGITASSAWFWITMIVQAIQLTAGFISKLNQAHDARKEAQIEDEKNKIDELQKAYQRLIDTIDDLSNITKVEFAYDVAKRKIEDQIASYEKMIGLEEDKKKTDKSKIKEYKESIQDLYDDLAELQEDLFSNATAGILDNIQDVAREWVDAWYDAFEETGHGLDALEDTFKESLLNMIKQQAALAIVTPFIDKVKKQVQDFVNADDLVLSIAEAKTLNDTISKDLPQLSENLETFFESLKAAGLDFGNSELSGLQRGIQGITETQADIIASYLNSIRFMMSEQSSSLSVLAKSLGGETIENPMLPQLKIIATNTQNIYDLLFGLTTTHQSGGRGIRVVT